MPITSSITSLNFELAGQSGMKKSRVIWLTELVRTFPISWHSDMPGWLVLGNPSEKGKVMDNITRIGVDLA
ncbi:hypothetical protein, partial [Paraburkholderia elongata]|uniref:hypothetical protein n=1 Tax=Paraburkholderia elongata TaxID=2675747 RepID=UPI001F3F5C8E